MTDDTDNCGSTDTNTGEPCQHSASRDDGYCHLHTDIEEERTVEGRPGLLEEYRDEIMQVAEEGLSYEGIARVAGIGRSTLDDWRREHEEFSQELERRRSVGERRRIEQADPEFILERSYGYTQEQDINLDADVDGNHDVTAEFVTYSADDDGDGSDGDE